MSKILLVYDDFAELNATELSLKKSGFDVIGLTNEYTVKDQIVAFNPEILVGFGNSQRVNSLSVGKKIKEMNRWTGKSILIFPKGYDLAAEELIRMRMDMLLESPISVIRLIQIICKLLKLDEKQVIEKLAKSFAKDRNDDLAYASYDSDTVKVIQNIQGELEQLGAEKGSTQNIPIDMERTEKEPLLEPKKSFFEIEPEENLVKKQTDEDPFAALISELSGGLPKQAKEDSASEDILDFNVVGQQIKDEIATSATKLTEKIKRYTLLTQEIQLSPESTIKKVKAKKQVNDLKKDWNTDELDDQDKIRREFVTELFKPKKS